MSIKDRIEQARADFRTDKCEGKRSEEEKRIRRKDEDVEFFAPVYLAMLEIEQAYGVLPGLDILVRPISCHFVDSISEFLFLSLEVWIGHEMERSYSVRVEQKGQYGKFDLYDVDTSEEAIEIAIQFVAKYAEEKDGTDT